MVDDLDSPSATTPGRFRFPGGLVLPVDAGEQTRTPIATMPPPDVAILPLSQHAGTPAIPVVAPGDEVLRGQLIARASGPVSANLHASISGTVRDIGRYPVASVSGLHEDCIVIAGDKRDRVVALSPLAEDYHQVDPNLLRQQVADAGVVGMGGAAFPTATKLAAAVQSGLSTLIINGSECDPAISCDEMTLREQTGDVIQGARVMLHILQINKCLIAIEADKREACDAVRSALESAGDDRLELIEVPAVYPEGGERQLIQVLSGQEVPSDGLPLDIGFICHNVGTTRAIAHAILERQNLISRVVTVCGPGIGQPRNVEVRLGTSVHDLVAFCGGYQDTASRLVMSGAMMGIALASDEVPIVKACNCILVLDETTARPAEAHLPCIRCGDCAVVCPASLLPQQLYWYTKAREFDRAMTFNVLDCIECGCCDVVCPSHIPLAEYFRHAKSELHKRDFERLRAGHAKMRFEERNRRLASEELQRQTRTEERKRALVAEEDGAREDPAKIIEAAVERARARRAALDSEDQTE